MSNLALVRAFPALHSRTRHTRRPWRRRASSPPPSPPGPDSMFGQDVSVIVEILSQVRSTAVAATTAS